MKVQTGPFIAGVTIAVAVAVLPVAAGTAAGPSPSSNSATKSPGAQERKARSASDKQHGKHRHHAKARRSITLKVSDLKPRVGSQITFTGRALTSRSVVLESRSKHSAWATVATLELTDKGRFSTPITVADATPRSYRVRVEGVRLGKAKTVTDAEKKKWKAERAAAKKAALKKAALKRAAKATVKGKAKAKAAAKDRSKDRSKRAGKRLHAHPKSGHKHGRQIGVSRTVRVTPVA